MNIPCFLIKETGRQRIYLRRYRSAEDDRCDKSGAGYHNAKVFIGEAAEKRTAEGYIDSVSPDVYADDPRWPASCACGYAFKVDDDRDRWQVFTESIYRRMDGAQEMTLREAPVGAMWNAWWMLPWKDGFYPTVRLPGGHDWSIDSRASNCDSPCKHCGKPYHAHDSKTCPKRYEDARPHQCWIRHGTPPVLTVDKAGPTCGAGAGSIIVPGWHGFLRNGVLVPC